MQYFVIFLKISQKGEKRVGYHKIEESAQLVEGRGKGSPPGVVSTRAEVLFYG